MATGNIRKTIKYCDTCMGHSSHERNGMVWGLGDFIMVLFTLGTWVLIRWGMNKFFNPWRCSICGNRA